MNGPQTFNIKVMQRMMSEEEMEAFVKKYQDHKKNLHGRGEALSQSITNEDLYILREYCLNQDRPLADLAEELGGHMSTFFGRAQRIAVRVIAQHPEVLDQVITQEMQEKKK